MARKIRRRTIIAFIGLGVLVIGVSVGGFVFFDNKSSVVEQQPEKNDSTEIIPEYQKKMQETRAKISDLIKTNDVESVTQADALIDAEVKAAISSADSDYIVDAQITKARTLIDTDRSEQALALLQSLDKEYSNTEAYKNSIYVGFSLAYTALGDTATAEGYLGQIEGRGGY